MKALALLVAAVVMIVFTGISYAADTWLDTGVGAISPQGNVLAIERFDANTILNFSWDNSAQTYLVIVLDNDGNLAAGPLGYPYLYFDVYSSYSDVYGSVPGGSWEFLVRIR